MSFGVLQTQGSYSNSQVEDIVQKAIIANNETFLLQLKSSEKEMKSLISDATKKSKLEMDSYLALQKEKNIEVLKVLLEQSELVQRRHTDDVLQDFAIFLEMQRQDDMDMIQARFENLVEDTQLNRMQTNQLISNLYSDENPTQNQY